METEGQEKYGENLLSDGVRLDAVMTEELHSAVVVLSNKLNDKKEEVGPFQTFFEKGSIDRWSEDSYSQTGYEIGETPRSMVGDLRRMLQMFVAGLETQLGVRGVFNYGWVRVGSYPGLQGGNWHSDMYCLQSVGVMDLPGHRRNTDLEVLKYRYGQGVAVNAVLSSLGDVELRPFVGVSDSVEIDEEGTERVFDFVHRRVNSGQVVESQGGVLDRVVFGAALDVTMAQGSGLSKYCSVVKKLVDRGLHGERGGELSEAVQTANSAALSMLRYRLIRKEGEV